MIANLQSTASIKYTIWSYPYMFSNFDISNN